MCADHMAFLYFFVSYTEFFDRGGKTLFCEINLLKINLRWGSGVSLSKEKISSPTKKICYFRRI